MLDGSARSSHHGPGSPFWQEELAADRLAVDIVDAALDAFRIAPPIRFMGADFFFLAAHLAELGLQTLELGRPVPFSDIFEPGRATSDTPHPIPGLRIANAQAHLAAMYPPDMYRGSLYHTAVLVAVATAAWHGIEPAILRMHANGTRPHLMWRGFDIFEHA
jgi:hypothetical protein